MKRTTHAALAALLLATAAGSASSPTAAGAAPAPVLSVSSGAPGTVIEVTSPGCAPDPAGEDLAVLRALFVVGTGSGARLAGGGAGGDGPVRIVVPDWVDPSEPAAVLATCTSYDPDTFERTDTDLDPAPFDVLPGLGAPQQTRTFDRTSILAGQGLRVRGTGCTVPEATRAEVVVVRGDDRSGAVLDAVASGEGDVTGTDIEAEVIVSDAAYGYDVTSTGAAPDEQVALGGYEEGIDLEPGTYTVFTLCGNEAGVNVFYEPQLVEVTGTAPTDQVDLTVAAGSRTAAFAGGGCTSGDVDVELESLDGRHLLEEGDEGPTDAELDGTRHLPFTTPARTQRSGSAAQLSPSPSPSPSRRAPRALADDEHLEATVTPDAAGSWRIADDVAFDDGFVTGFATCGDPYGDGFRYDPQVAVVDVATAPVTEPTTPVTAPAPTPPAAPAGAVAGTPTYAG